MNRYLVKLADIALRPHQERAVSKAEANPIIAVHSLGSGKTLTALSLVQQHKPALVITPASLVTNMWKEVEKHDLPIRKSDMTVVSYDMLSRDPDKYTNKQWGAIILDEAHGHVPQWHQCHPQRISQ